jgi:RimJ/RimL family protein N-acetyltransferase
MNIKKSQSSNNVVLYLGSNPPYALINSIIITINKNFLDHLNKITILKSLNSPWDDIILQKKNVRLINNPTDTEMSECFSDCSIVITNLGQSSYEIQSLKLPAIFIMTVDNQINHYNLFTEGGFITMAMYDDWNSLEFSNSLSVKIRELLSKGYQTISNGYLMNHSIKGSSNIINELINFTNTLELRLADFSDSNFLFDLHNDVSVRVHSFNEKKTTIIEHENWLINSLDNSNKVIFIIANRELKLGQLRLDYSIPSATISISIHRNYRGLGVAKSAIKSLLDHQSLINHEVTILLAFVKFDNQVSKKLFQSLGFLEEEVEDRIRFTLKVGKLHEEY